MSIHVTFFAAMKEKAGRTEYVLETGAPITVKELKEMISRAFPAIEPGKDQVLVAVNREFSFDDELVPEEAEVALFPPVSGGAAGPTICRIVTSELDLDSLLDEITSEATGAACIFTGIVRGFTEKGEFHQTSSLEYEAYRPMAEAKLSQVAEEIRARWPSVEGISIVQRIGLMGPRTPTVVVACSASHRSTGVFEAARYGIDRLKEIVPIWKKEIGPDGENWVEGTYIPGRGD